MTWIKTINHEDAGPELKKLWDEARSLYPPEYRVSVDAIDESHGGGISQSHTLLPKVLYHAFGLLGEALSPELPLERKHHEMIATVVSATNSCFY